MLIVKSAKVNDKNLVGSTALMFASLVGKKEMVEFLIEKGADISVQDERGNTTLSLVEQQGAEEVAAILSEKMRNL